MPCCRGVDVKSSPVSSTTQRVRLPTLTLYALTLCLETSLRHAIHLGRRLNLPIRRLPTLILELLAIRPLMQDNAVIERFEKAGSQVAYLDGPEFARFLEADTDRLLKVVRQIGLS